MSQQSSLLVILSQALDWACVCVGAGDGVLERPRVEGWNWG